MDVTAESDSDQVGSTARERVVGALVDAAIDLFGTRGPDAVSLREVAAKANVNYGLIHHYVGTKDDLISLALQQVSARSTERFASDELDETVHRLVEGSPTSPNLRLLAWSLLQGRTADDLIGRSTALAALADRIASTSAKPVDRQRVVVLMSLLLGWQLFGDYLNESLDLTPTSRPNTARLVEETALRLVTAKD